MAASGIAEDRKGWLFRTARGHNGTALSDQAMSQPDAWRMIRRRAAAAGIAAHIGNHSFRATGITAYLGNGGALEHAQEMAGHASPRTTKLYDRTKERLTQDEVERIRLRDRHVSIVTTKRDRGVADEQAFPGWNPRPWGAKDVEIPYLYTTYKPPHDGIRTVRSALIQPKPAIGLVTTDHIVRELPCCRSLQRVQPGAHLAKGTRMSLASSLASPTNLGILSTRGLLRGGSLQSMARAVGVVLGAGLLAASYQIAYKEGQAIVHSLRVGARHRRARNDAVMLALIGTALPLDRLGDLRRARDVFRVCMTLLTDPSIPDEHRAIIRAALSSVAGEIQQA
jgi:hypothetical protein